MNKGPDNVETMKVKEPGCAGVNERWLLTMVQQFHRGLKLAFGAGDVVLLGMRQALAIGGDN